MPTTMKDNSEMTLSVRNALMEVLPMGVNVWKHCRECLKELACASARQLLFHTFALICKEESYPSLSNKSLAPAMTSELKRFEILWIERPISLFSPDRMAAARASGT